MSRSPVPYPTPSIKYYLRELLAHGASVFSAIVFVAALLRLLLPGELTEKLASSGLLVLTSVLIASFNTWKAAVMRLPREAALDIAVRGVEVGTRSAKNSIPNSPLEIRISMDAVNQGQEAAMLTAIEVAGIELGTPLLSASPIGHSLTINARHLELPFQLEGGKREPGLRSVIQVELLEREPEQFATLLGELKDFQIDLLYKYENMRRDQQESMLRVQSSFAEFKKRQVERWKRDKRFDLVVKATEAAKPHE